MERNVRRIVFILSIFIALPLYQADVFGQSAVPRIKVSGDRFLASDSGETFTPWGFNYDRDLKYRLIEDYWAREWGKVERDFGELHALGANVVRIYLQYHRFMDTPTSANEANLSRLKDLVSLAESRGIYLDITGLGSFRPEDDPPWYVALSEKDRWAAQATFWEAISEALADRPGVFAFNLMNEPIVSGERLARGAWVHPDEIKGLHYIHYINLAPDGRNRADIAVAWIREMKRAIRKHDGERLVTVGLFPLFGSPDATGFAPARIAPEVDFISVHLYPQAGRAYETVDLLKKYHVGLPVLIEETFPLNGGIADYQTFLKGSRGIAAGWLSFYWGMSDELGEHDDPTERLAGDAIRVFRNFRPQ
jgi:hypothetical protein